MRNLCRTSLLWRYGKARELQESGHSTVFRWIPAHSGLIGNDKAHLAAKSRTERGGKQAESWSSLAYIKKNLSPRSAIPSLELSITPEFQHLHQRTFGLPFRWNFGGFTRYHRDPRSHTPSFMTDSSSRAENSFAPKPTLEAMRTPPRGNPRTSTSFFPSPCFFDPSCPPPLLPSPLLPFPLLHPLLLPSPLLLFFLLFFYLRLFFFLFSSFFVFHIDDKGGWKEKNEGGMWVYYFVDVVMGGYGGCGDCRDVTDKKRGEWDS